MRDYVDRNLSKFKHDVPSVFMDKAQLSRFYADMLTCQNNENFKERNKSSSTQKCMPKCKSKSTLCRKTVKLQWSK